MQAARPVPERGAPVRVFMPCTGLGRERRGFETFTRECADAMRAQPAVSVTVFGGGGAMRAGERTSRSLPRSGVLARALGGIMGRDPYHVEQLSFFPGFAGALLAESPDLVYFADLNLGNACWHWRRLTGQRFRLLYYNGGPTTRPFTRCDAVQQVSPEHLASAIGRGEQAERQFLLPHGLTIAREFRPATPSERAARRAELGIPVDAQVVLSVGALNASHKRMDYVIDEVATMRLSPHLVLLGAETPETAAIRNRAAMRLPGRCTIKTVDRDAVLRAYAAADIFVLASLTEGFGIAQVEAMAAGLPCIAHDSPTNAYVLGRHGVLSDLRHPGMLAPILDRFLSGAQGKPADRHAHVFDNFSWDVLAPRYVDALVATAHGRRPTFAEQQ